MGWSARVNRKWLKTIKGVTKKEKKKCPPRLHRRLGPWTIFSLPGARRPDVVVDLATVTWTAPGVSAFADVPVLRWPLRDPALASDRRERRGLAEVVRDALSGRIADELVTRLFTPDRDRRTPGLALAGP